MNSLFFDYEFESKIRNHDVGSQRYRYTVAFLPDQLKAVLPLKEYPRLRISGEANGYPFEAALTPVKGEWYILFSKHTLSEIDCGVGDRVEIKFNIADQNAVDVPSSLATALQLDPDMQALWQQQTPGKQRAHCYRVGSAKTDKTQQKRIAEVFDILTGKRDMRGKLI